MKYIRPAADSAVYTASCYRSIIAEHGYVLSFTRGVSMRPLIWSGKHYVAIMPVDEPVVGDILLFEQIRKGATACILHRLVEIRSDANGTPLYVTRGDNCLGCEYIRREDIIGKVSDIFLQSSDKIYFAVHGDHITMTGKAYLRYVRFWNRTWPLRRLFYRMRSFAARIYHFIFK